MIIFIQQYGLTLMILSPLLGALGLICFKGRRVSVLLSVLGAGLALVTGGVLLATLRHVGGLEFSHQVAWIPSWKVAYWVGVDGLSFYLLAMTVVLMPILLFIEFAAAETFRRRAFFLLILEAALLGIYLALDMFLFLFCLELATLSLFFYLGAKESGLSGLSGHRFLILNLLGSGLLLMSIAALYQAAGGTSHLARLLQEPMAPAQQPLWCGVFLAALVIKGALVPWHAWLRDLEPRLDPGLLIAVNALYLPVGGYALMRFGYVLFPYGLARLQPFLMMAALLSLILVCLWAWGGRQRQALPAYISLALAAWMMLGISTMSSDGVKGAIYLMGQHAWVMALFSMVIVLYASPGQREKRWALLLATLACLALIAFPGSGAFVAFFLIGGAAFREQPLWVLFALVSWIAVGGLLFRERRAVFNKTSAVATGTRQGAWMIAVALVLLIGWGGLHPDSVLQMIQRDGDAWLNRLHTTQVSRGEGHP